MAESDVECIFCIMKHNMQPYYEARGEKWNGDSIRRYFLSMDSAVLEQEGNVCAFTFFERAPKNIHIHTFQVAPDRQNGVLGGKLFRWYLTMAKQNGCSELTCSVYDSNPALGMYLRMGFEETRRDKGIIQLSLPLTRRANTPPEVAVGRS